MALILKKYSLYQLLFCLCISLPYLNNYELTFAIWTLTILLTLKRTYSKTIVTHVAFFFSIFVVAAISSFFWEHKNYNLFRDVTYLFKPIIGLIVGYQLFKMNKEKAFKTIINSGAFISIIHLIIVFITFLRFRTISVNLLREFCGYFSDYEIYVLIILLFHKQFQLDFSKQKIRMLIIIVGLSSFLYLARTNMIQFVILFVGMKGYFTVTKKSVRIIGIVLLTTITTYSAIYVSNPKRNGRGIEAFLYKIKIAPIEPFKTKIDTDDWKDFNDNYRSFESITTVKTMSNAGSSAIFFGKGLGSTIDLGRDVMSNDGEYVRYIAVVHNGFMTVFLKSGILGVLICLLSIIYLLKQNKSDINLVRNLNYLLIGTGVFLFISYWVFLGFYFKYDNKSVLIGFIIALKEFLQRQNNVDTKTISE